MSDRMESYQREIILSNIDTIREWTIYCKLKAGCIERQILSHEIIEEIERSSANESARHVQLLRKLTESGPNAFKQLIDICQSNFWDAADFLSSFETSDDYPRSRRGSVHNQTDLNVEKDGNIASFFKGMSIENIALELYTDETENDASIITLILAVEFGHRNILAYPMKSKNRGVLFLFNIIEIRNQPKKYRNGAILDKIKLITLFRAFGFKIFYYENLKNNVLKEFEHLVAELVKSQHLRSTDCLVFTVLSLGCLKAGHQMIEFSDGNRGSIEDVIIQFSNVNFRNLFQKPKLFIFPMCRGIASKIKVKNFGIPNAHLQGNNIPAFTDIKICYGSVKGFETFRDPYVGSWYITAFCEILALYAHKEHFDDLHKLIGQRLEGFRESRSNGNENFIQTISSEDLGFTKHLFFNPGYYG